MPNCDFINNGWTGPCRQYFGGTDLAYIGPYSGDTTYSEDADGVITAATNAGTFYEFKQYPKAAQLTDTASFPDTGGRYWTQEATIRLEGMSAEIRNKLDLLSQGRVRVIMKDQKGDHFLIGKTRGVWMSSAEGGTGQGPDDINGYTITFSNEEFLPVQPVADSALTDFGI